MTSQLTEPAALPEPGGRRPALPGARPLAAAPVTARPGTPAAGASR